MKVTSSISKIDAGKQINNFSKTDSKLQGDTVKSFSENQSKTPSVEVKFEGDVYEKDKQKIKKQGNVNSILKKIQEEFNPFDKVLKVEIDKDLKVPVFKLIDEKTHQVIRQIPWEETLKLWKAIEELLKKKELKEAELKGIFLKKEV